MAFNYSPKIVTDGLVLYLDAANSRSYPGSGTAWNDLSRRGNNSTLTNGPTFTTDGLGAIVFDGVDDYIDCGGKIVSADPDSTGIFWIRTTQDGGPQGKAIYCERPPSGNDIFKIEQSASSLGNRLQFVHRDTAGNLTLIRGGSAINNGQWYNVAFTKVNTSLILYINGVSIASSNIASNILSSTTTVTRIGSDVAGSVAYFNGLIVLGNVYNRALSADEVLQNYNATKTRFGL